MGIESLFESPNQPSWLHHLPSQEEHSSSTGEGLPRTGGLERLPWSGGDGHHCPIPPDLSEKMSDVSSHVPDQLLSIQEKETFT